MVAAAARDRELISADIYAFHLSALDGAFVVRCRDAAILDLTSARTVSQFQPALADFASR
jgi:hypothetical protein